jgi:hypothetical protein
MRESCKYGSVRGAGSNPRPYRNRREFTAGLGSTVVSPAVARAQQQESFADVTDTAAVALRNPVVRFSRRR